MFPEAKTESFQPVISPYMWCDEGQTQPRVSSKHCAELAADKQELPLLLAGAPTKGSKVAEKEAYE